MARLSSASFLTSPVSRPADPLTDLNRLLGRLQQTVLRADAEREKRLRTSEYERNKVGVNIEYARSLLSRMEQDALSVKVHTRRQELQADLNRKRELLEQLTDRMKDLEEMSVDDDDDASSDGEDILGGIIATPSESLDSRSTDILTEDTGDEDTGPSQPVEEQAPVPSERVTRAAALQGQVAAEDYTAEKPETFTSQTLRARGKQPERDHPEEEQDMAQTTGSARSLLFGDRASTSVSVTGTQEAILDNQHAEQDLLSESILKMANDLKLSSVAFGEALNEDTEVLERTGEGLDKNERGLESAARRMGALTRITEGKGWFARLMLYAWIYGMMVFLVLLVFVLPKLRF